MKWLAIARLDALASIRRIVPWRAVRVGGGILVSVLTVLAVAGMAVAPLPGSVAPTAGVVAGFATLVASVALPLAVAGAASAVRVEGRAWVYLSSPLTPARVVVALLLPPLLLAALPVVVLYAPFVTVVARQSLATAAVLLATGAATAAWTAVGGAAIVAESSVRFGRERGLQVAYVVALGALFGATLASGPLFGASVTSGAWLTLLAAGALAWGPVARVVGRRLLLAAGAPAPSREAKPVVWGALRPWQRVLRSPGSPGLVISGTLFVVVAVAGTGGARDLTLALLAATIAGLPAGLALAEDHAHPDRLRLAPAGRRLARRLVLQLSAPAVAAVALALIWAGWADLGFVVGAVAIAAVYPATQLLLDAPRRRGAQIVLLLLSCLTPLL